MEEIVKYNNFMNDLTLGGFKAIELDLLMALCNQYKDKGTQVLEFSFADIKRLIESKVRYMSNEDILKTLKGINKKLLNLDIMVETETEIIQFVLFTDFTVDKAFTYYRAGVHPKFGYILNELTNNFTTFELKEFVSLKSKYSKNLYRLLKQFDNNQSGWRTFKADDLREKLGCPKSYPNKRFVAEILNPCVAELSNIFADFRMEITRSRTKGNPITGFEFRWKVCVNDELPGQMHISDFLDTDMSIDEKKRAVGIANSVIKGDFKRKDTLTHGDVRPKDKHGDFHQRGDGMLEKDYKRYYELLEKKMFSPLTPEEEEEYLKLHSIYENT